MPCALQNFGKGMPPREGSALLPQNGHNFHPPALLAFRMVEDVHCSASEKTCESISAISPLTSTTGSRWNVQSSARPPRRIDSSFFAILILAGVTHNAPGKDPFRSATSQGCSEVLGLSLPSVSVAFTSVSATSPKSLELADWSCEESRRAVGEVVGGVTSVDGAAEIAAAIA